MTNWYLRFVARSSKSILFAMTMQGMCGQCVRISVPCLQVLVRDLARCVENEDGRMRTVIITRVQLVEGLLTCRVPDVNLKRLALYLRPVTVHRQRVSGGRPL